VLALITLRKLRVRVRDPVRIAYEAFCEKLRARGLPPASSEGPLDYAERIVGLRPELQSAVSRISQLYVRLRYGREAKTNELGELQQLAREFKA
jgi:hypothetical protein